MLSPINVPRESKFKVMSIGLDFYHGPIRGWLGEFFSKHFMGLQIGPFLELAQQRRGVTSLVGARLGWKGGMSRESLLPRRLGH